MSLHIWRRRRILSTCVPMNFWPPKPGFTDITRMRSTTSSTSSMALVGVPGLSTAPARQPSSLIWFRVRWRWMVAAFSACTEMMSAPALAKSATRSSGSTIICKAHGELRVESQQQKAVAELVPWVSHWSWTVVAVRDKATRGVAVQNTAQRTHQVNIKRLLGDWSDGIDNEGSDGDVGHEAAVHDVHVHPVAACIIDGFNLHNSVCSVYWTGCHEERSSAENILGSPVTGPCIGSPWTGVHS